VEAEDGKTMKKKLAKFQKFLENVDSYRDRVLFVFIKPYWPRAITPNHITYIRVVIGVLLFVLLFYFKIENKTLILSLFTFGVLTDLIDGPVARGTKRVTEFGATLDSTADRIILAPIAIYSLFLHGHQWLLLILVSMELINGIFAIYYRTKEIYLESNIFGKTKMVLLSVPFIAMLFYWPNFPHPFFLWMLWVTIPFSILSILSKVLDLKQHA